MNILARYVPFYNGDTKNLFFATVKKYFPMKAQYSRVMNEHDEVEAAFNEAGIIRFSGESYVTHLERVSLINIDTRVRSRGRYSLNYTDVIFTLHHDTLEDLEGLNGYNLGFFKREFGEDFAIDLLSVSNTKVDGRFFKDKMAAEADTYRRVVASRVRSQICKLCDRLDFFIDYHSVSREATDDKIAKTRLYLMDVAWRLNVLPCELEMAMLIAEGMVKPI